MPLLSPVTPPHETGPPQPEQRSVALPSGSPGFGDCRGWQGQFDGQSHHSQPLLSADSPPCCERGGGKQEELLLCSVVPSVLLVTPRWRRQEAPRRAGCAVAIPGEVGLSGPQTRQGVEEGERLPVKKRGLGGKEESRIQSRFLRTCAVFHMFT